MIMQRHHVPGELTLPLKREESFSFFSHLLGSATALVGSLILALRSETAALLAVSLIYGLSMTFMFSASALYHAFKTEEGGSGFWRRLDHLAIFFMIAGSYTPVCYVHLSGGWRWSILGVQWGLVLLGVVFKLLFINAPRALVAAIYLVMGWVVVIPFKQLVASLPAADLALFILGGVAYSIGAIIYAAKRPNPLPGLFGFHEIFHVLVLVGAGIHYLTTYRILS
jgi:hemolysin III